MNILWRSNIERTKAMRGICDRQTDKQTNITKMTHFRLWKLYHGPISVLVWC